MNYKYSLTEKVYSDSLHPHISYGIKADDGVHTPVQIDDISTDKEKVNRLVSQCNELKLSTVHLFDVIEDIL